MESRYLSDDPAGHSLPVPAVFSGNHRDLFCTAPDRIYRLTVKD